MEVSEVTYYAKDISGKVVHIPVTEQRWRIEAMYDDHLHSVIEYDGSDYNELAECIGGLCLSMAVDRVIIYRNNEQHRRIKLR